MLGVDEYSDLLWAVEHRVGSTDMRTPSAVERGVVAPTAATGPVNAPEQQYRYLPAVDALPYWHPYVLSEFDGHRRFVQGRLADTRGLLPASWNPSPPPRSSTTDGWFLRSRST